MIEFRALARAADECWKVEMGRFLQILPTPLRRHDASVCRLEVLTDPRGKSMVTIQDSFVWTQR
jgi:hypothetical protein